MNETALVALRPSLVCLLWLSSSACSDYKATFYAESVDARFEGCDFDGAHELRAEYLPWDDLALLSVEYDPITYVLEICTLQSDPFFDETKPTWCVSLFTVSRTEASTFSGTIEGVDADGEPTSATYSETIEVDIVPSIDTEQRRLELAGTIRRVRTCDGDCDEVPHGSCHVTVDLSAYATEDVSFLEGIWAE